MACFQQFVGQLLSEAVRKQRPGIVNEAVFQTRNLFERSELGL
jgi:hypothetical protein